MAKIDRYGILYATNNPKNVVVCTDEAYLNKDTGRVVSRKSLLNKVVKKCSAYINGKCKDCETEKEIMCHAAWSLTIGKGKKLY